MTLAHGLPAGLPATVLTCDLDARAATDEKALLSTDETLRANRFVFDRDRRRFIRGRAFLRQQLGQALGVAPGSIHFAAATGGKPFVVGAPLRFNLSYSANLAVLALTGGAEVGIDVELVTSEGGLARDVPLLSSRVLNAAENACLAQVPPGDRLRAFLALWTAKEAQMKLTGEGLRLDPRRIALDLQGCRPVGYLAPRSPPARLWPVPVAGFAAVCFLAMHEDRAA